MAELCHLGVGWVGLLPVLCILRSFHVSRMACFSVYITDASFWNSEIWWQRPYLIYLTRAVDRLKHLLAKDAIHFLHWKQKVFLFLLLIWPMFIPQHCAPKKRQTSKRRDRMDPISWHHDVPVILLPSLHLHRMDTRVTLSLASYLDT